MAGLSASSRSTAALAAFAYQGRVHMCVWVCGLAAESKGIRQQTLNLIYPYLLTLTASVPGSVIATKSSSCVCKHGGFGG